ncbi:oxidoreductase AflX [Microdochium nivale]|nr:oxidoreductase AflX [Microdochium nivale]
MLQPNCRIARNQAESAIAALERIREHDSKAKLLLLMILSSSETDSGLNDVPWPMGSIMFRASFPIYTGLIAAEAYIRQRAD